MIPSHRFAYVTRLRGAALPFSADAPSATGATSFAPGDRVYGTTGIGLGAYAEYVCVGGRRAGSVRPLSSTWPLVSASFCSRFSSE